MNNHPYIKIITEICEERRIEISFLSYNWIIQLKKDDKTRYIVGTHFNLNTDASTKIIDDKYACYEVLSSNNVPIIEHFMLFNPLNNEKYSLDDNWKDAIAFFHQNNNEVIVKPNDGAQGRNVFRITSLESMQIAAEKIFQNKYSLTICPFYNYEYEYRIFYINGACVACYGKIKPFIIGNGKNTISELIIKKFSKIEINPDPNLNIDFDTYIPLVNEKIQVSWKHNLSGGADAFLINDSVLENKLYELAKCAANSINIKSATIDIIQLKDGSLMILEINSSVATKGFIERIPSGYEIAKKVYSVAIDAIFE